MVWWGDIGGDGVLRRIIVAIERSGYDTELRFTTGMITEEEFNVFQSQLVDLGQRNFRLQSERDELLEKNAQLPKLKTELADTQTSRSEMKERLSKQLQDLKQELETLQRRASEQAEENSKRIADRKSQLKQSISETAQIIKDKNQKVEDLQHQVRSIEVRVQQKNMKLERLEAREKTYAPFVDFLQKSRAFPMYIEDLSSRIGWAVEMNRASEAALSKLDEKVAALQKLGEELETKIQEKTSEIDGANANLKDTTAKVEAANEEIARIKEARDTAAAQLEDAKLALEKTMEERKAELQRLREHRKEVEAEIEERGKVRDKLQSELDKATAEREEELGTYSVKVQELRKKLSVIKETGEGEEIPRVDRDLQAQINKIIQERKQLSDNTQMLQQAIELVEVEMNDNEREIQKLILRSEPTPRILALPEFQQKQLLLEELVLQNQQLREEIPALEAKLRSAKA